MGMCRADPRDRPEPRLRAARQRGVTSTQQRGREGVSHRVPLAHLIPAVRNSFAETPLSFSSAMLKPVGVGEIARSEHTERHRAELAAAGPV